MYEEMKKGKEKKYFIAMFECTFGLKEIILCE